MKKWLITGASSGFGRLLAERVASDGDHVIAVARREDRLRELAADHDSVTPLVADLTAPGLEPRLAPDSRRAASTPALSLSQIEHTPARALRSLPGWTTRDSAGADCRILAMRKHARRLGAADRP